MLPDSSVKIRHRDPSSHGGRVTLQSINQLVYLRKFQACHLTIQLSLPLISQGKIFAENSFLLSLKTPEMQSSALSESSKNQLKRVSKYKYFDDTGPRSSQCRSQLCLVSIQTSARIAK